MKHPLYNDPEYVKAVDDSNYFRKQMQELQNQEYRAWKIVEEKEKAFREKYPNYPKDYPNKN